MRRGEDGGSVSSQLALVILLAVTDEAPAERSCDVRLSLSATCVDCGAGMHYATVSWDSREFWEAVRREDYATAADTAPISGVALSNAAGPLVSYAMVAGCC